MSAPRCRGDARASRRATCKYIINLLPTVIIHALFQVTIASIGFSVFSCRSPLAASLWPSDGERLSAAHQYVARALSHILADGLGGGFAFRSPPVDV